MNKFIKALSLTFLLSFAIAAQTNSDEYKKNEYYVGYSNQQIDSGNHQTFNGFEGAYVRNIHRYFGIKADVSGAYRNQDVNVTFNSGTTGSFSYRGKYDRSLYNVLGGVQVKNNTSDARFKPFAHALAGVAVVRAKQTALTCTAGTCPSFVGNSFAGTFRDTNFSAAVGGGLDIKVSDKIDFRALQVDYNPVFGSGFRQDNVRFGIGVVFK